MSDLEKATIDDRFRKGTRFRRWIAVARLSSALLVLTMGGACQSLPPELAEPPPPSGPEAPRIRPGIRINVTVEVARSVQTRAENVRVSQNGEVALPLVGDVQVDGMTLREAENVLIEAYAAYYVDPSVRADFVAESGDASSPWGYVTVLGQVRNPGRVNLPPTRDLTVTRAIQLAGGLGNSARERSVRISRWNADGQRDEMRINLRKVGARGARHEDVLLRDGDVVFVPETFF